MSGQDLIRVRTDLEFAARHYADIVDGKIPGTRKPWHEPTMRPEDRAERDRQARLERAERGEYALSESRAPLDLTMMDAAADILARADMLAEQIAGWAGIDRLDHACSVFDDAAPYLRFAAMWADQAIEACPDVLEFVVDEARELMRATSRVLGMVYDGQTLKASCVWCRGVDPQNPAGGGLTLRVQSLPGGLVAVVCLNPGCDPSEADCGTRWHGHPAWPIHEWEWLAQRIEAESERLGA